MPEQSTNKLLEQAFWMITQQQSMKGNPQQIDQTDGHCVDLFHITNKYENSQKVYEGKNLKATWRKLTYAC